MRKYLFLVFVFIGCSSKNLKETPKDFVKKDEKYLLLKGANLYSLGKKSEALLVYQEILKINNKNSVALREKAVIEGQLGNIKQAEKDFLKSLLLNSDDNLTLKNLAYLNFEKKNYIKSSEYLKRVSKDFKSDQDYFILGYIEFLNGSYLNSLKYYDVIGDESIFNNSLFFDSYLSSLKQENILNKDVYIRIEDKIKSNKKSTIKLSNFYSTFLKRDDFAERVLKKYLTYNELDKEIINELINIYYKSGDEIKAKKALKLISN
ncbi:hypothetical protein NON08_08425 [Cetobacterium somerae]|uniref:tetratricopeptide repeat protein n=1 Tax=Cetobacterium sp. NK01 TaxID=2993530 RepID=UPI002116101B|nr:hypothetical protein [Cetobacterium sp. NK01]MCQ8212545.1 hypothetical protein [Cetobacterium sp. NK01]